MGAIAASASATTPLSGQKARSGFNFQLLSNNGSTITLVAPQGVVFDIKEDVSGSDPTPVSKATNGSTIDGGALKTGKNYYIANPSNAHASFAVELTQG